MRSCTSAKLDRPGDWAHGDRSERHRTRKAAPAKVIGVIDDHTRPAYCEMHATENAVTVSATLCLAAGQEVTVIVGIDVHKQAHAAALLDDRGGEIGTLMVQNSPEGYRRLLA